MRGGTSAQTLPHAVPAPALAQSSASRPVPVLAQRLATAIAPLQHLEALPSTAAATARAAATGSSEPAVAFASETDTQLRA